MALSMSMSLSPMVQQSHQVARATLLIVKSLAHVAQVQLHHTFSAKDPNAHIKCLEFARQVLNYIPLIDGDDYAYLDPIMGVSLPFLLCVYSQFTYSLFV